MPEFPETIDDRRVVERITLSEPWRADAMFKDCRCELSVLDISNQGAKMHTTQPYEIGVLPPDFQTDFIVHSPSGKTIPVRASISWSFRFPEGYLMGIRFIDGIDAQLLHEAYEYGKDKQTETTVN